MKEIQKKFEKIKLIHGGGCLWRIRLNCGHFQWFTGKQKTAQIATCGNIYCNKNCKNYSKFQ